MDPKYPDPPPPHQCLNPGLSTPQQVTILNSQTGKGGGGQEEEEEEEEEEKRRGRQRLRWLENAEKDLWDMKVKRWQHKAPDREEWAFVIREAKDLRGPSKQGMSD
jgi:hypothetical protein